MEKLSQACKKRGSRQRDSNEVVSVVRIVEKTHSDVKVNGRFRGT
jgi:hypothetical protein